MRRIYNVVCIRLKKWMYNFYIGYQKFKQWYRHADRRWFRERINELKGPLWVAVFNWALSDLFN